MENLTVEQAEGMSIEQLEQHVAQEGVLEAPQGEATGAEATSNNGEATGTATEVKEEAPPAWFQKYSDNMKRELGSLRSLQGLGDKLPQMVEKQLEARLAKLAQAQQNANLSPEDQQAQVQLQTQQEALDKYVQDMADKRFQEAAKDYIPVLNELIEGRKNVELKNQTLGMVKDLIPEGASEIWEETFEQIAKDIEAEKPGALERYESMVSNPGNIALAMIQAQRSKVQSQVGQVEANRSNQARQAAQGPQSSVTKSQGKKAVAEMSQVELDKLSTAELEAGIPEQ